MRVELIGGPRDGEVIEVPDGTLTWNFPILRKFTFFDQSNGIPELEPFYSTAHVYRKKGRYVIDVPKETYL